MQLLDYVFVCSLNVVFVSLFARLDAKDVNMHPNHEYNCSGFKILTCSPRLVVTNLHFGGYNDWFRHSQSQPNTFQCYFIYLFLFYFWGFSSSFFLSFRASFIVFVVFPSLGVLALEGGTLLLLLSCLLLSWCWVALVIVPPSKVYLCYRAALIVTFQLLGFFFPAQLDPDL
jgi:hypothetical protein